MSFFDEMLDRVGNYAVTGVVLLGAVGVFLAGTAIYLLVGLMIAGIISEMRYEMYLAQEEERFDRIVEAKGGNVKTTDILNSVFPGYEEAESPYSSTYEYVSGSVFGVGRSDEP